MFKFERLEIYQSALDYVDRCYTIAGQLPDTERYDLSSQLQRAAVSITLNIAEGSRANPMPSRCAFWGWRCGHSWRP